MKPGQHPQGDEDQDDLRCLDADDRGDEPRQAGGEEDAHSPGAQEGVHGHTERDVHSGDEHQRQHAGWNRPRRRRGEEPERPVGEDQVATERHPVADGEVKSGLPRCVDARLHAQAVVPAAHDDDEQSGDEGAM